jgi:hypothetical protein
MPRTSNSDGSTIVAEDHADGTTEIRAEIGGTPVSRTFIFPMLIRIGEAVVRMDGIGGVATDQAHRHQGHSRRVLEGAVDAMIVGDAALSTLYGIPDFYHRFGFATAGAEYTVTLPTRSSAPSDVPAGWEVRPFTAGDLPAVARLYQLATARATGAVPRQLDTDQPHPGQRPAVSALSRRAWHRLSQRAGTDECRVLIDPEGSVAAYAWIGRDTWWIRNRLEDAPSSFHIGEPVARDPVAADALVAACLAWARESASGPDLLELVIPPEGPVANAAAYEGATFVQRHTRHGEFMARVLDVGRLFRQMLPEVRARLRRSELGYRGPLSLHAGEASVTLAIDGDRIDIVASPSHRGLSVTLTEDALARMALGAFEPEDLAARLPDPPGRDVVKVLAAMFPKRAGHIYPADRF